MKPLVSVLMSVHNEPFEFIQTAVDSICKQTYSNLEFIIIDDASEETTYKHLLDLKDKYNVIKLYRNEYNIGLTKTLNKGLTLCSGEYIARMDADDYSLPERIDKQVDYLIAHPEIDVLGTGVVSFGEKVVYMSPLNGYSNNQVQSELFFTSSLCHPSVMIRNRFLELNGLKYDESVKKGQDYDLWERSSVYGKLAVHSDVLLYYRLHSKQITSVSYQEQNNTAEMIIKRRLRRIGLIPTDHEMKCHMSLKGQIHDVTVKEVHEWIEKLIRYSNRAGYIDGKELSANLKDRFILMKIRRHLLPDMSELYSTVNIFIHRIALNLKLAKYRQIVKKLYKQ